MVDDSLDSLGIGDEELRFAILVGKSNMAPLRRPPQPSIQLPGRSKARGILGPGLYSNLESYLG